MPALVGLESQALVFISIAIWLFMIYSRCFQVATWLLTRLTDRKWRANKILVMEWSIDHVLTCGELRDQHMVVTTTTSPMIAKSFTAN